MLEGFQAGLSCTVILRKREAFRLAFQGFRPELVARFGGADVARLVEEPGIVRSRAKIEATVAGARVYEAMRASGEDFSSFVWGMAGGRPIQGAGPVPAGTPLSEELSEELSKALKKKGLSSWAPWSSTRGCRQPASSTTTRGYSSAEARSGDRLALLQRHKWGLDGAPFAN